MEISRIDEHAEIKSSFRANPPRWLTVPLKAFVITRILILIGAYLPAAAGIILFRPLDFNNVPLSHVPALLQPWTCWDAKWYTRIAEQYTPGSHNQDENYVIFFPLYPVSTHLVALITRNTLLAGLLVSNVCLVLALILLYRLVEDMTDPRTAGRTVYYVTLFPTSFFFSAAYTESLFFVLALACAYAAYHRQWLWAGIAGGLATATRTLGLLLVILVGLEWARAHGWTIDSSLKAESWRNLFNRIRRDWPGLLTLGFIPLGMLAYMVYLQLAFGNPLAFNDSLGAWGREAVSFGEAVLNAFRNRPELHVLPYYRMIEVLTFFVAQIIALMAWRRLGASYGLYAFVTLWVGALAADLENQMRYPLVLFPLFIVLAFYGRNPRFDAFYRSAGAVLLVVFTFFFTNCIWIG
jgi:hypothetical protein